MFESCLRNYKERICVLFFVATSISSHAPGRSSSQAKRPFGPSASLASATTKNAFAFFFCC